MDVNSKQNWNLLKTIWQVGSEMHWFGSEKGESEDFCKKYEYNGTSVMREMLSLAEQLLFLKKHFYLCS